MPDPNDGLPPFQLPGVVTNPGATSTILKNVGPSAAPPEAPKPPSIEDIQRSILMKKQQLLDQYVQTRQQEIAQKQAQARAAAASGYQLDAMHRKAATDPLPPAYTPQRMEMPAAPPRFSPRDPAIAIAQPLSLLATIGGLFARRAGTASIRSMTAAMEGLREGDQQKYENAIKEFDEHLKLATEYNRAEHEKYEEAWGNRKNTMAERQAQLTMLSTQYGNKAMAQALSTGNSELIQAEISALDGTFKNLTEMAKIGKGEAGHQMDTQKARAVQEQVDKGVPRDQAIRNVEAKLGFDEKKQLEDQKQGNRMDVLERNIAARIQMAKDRGESAEELERIKQEGRTQLQSQRHTDKLDEDAEKRKRAESDLSTLNKVNAADVRMRADKIRQEAEAAGDTQRAQNALVEALEQHNAFKSGASFSKLPPNLQQSINQGWPEAAKDFQEGAYKMDAPTIRRLSSAAEVVSVGEKIADFVSTHPWALGALATFQTMIRDEPMVLGKAEAESVSQRIDSLIPSITLPNGARLTPSEAGDAALLNKLLLQLALSDAAQVSTNGQGGTVYLDRQFRSIYSQLTSPSTMLRFIHARQEEGNDIWQSRGDNRFDWHQRPDKDSRPFFETPNSYQERTIFHTYDRVPPQKFQQTIESDKTLKDYPQMKLALQLRQYVKTPEQLQQWAQQQVAAAQAGKITPEQLQQAKQAAGILLWNMQHPPKEQ